MLHCCLDMVEAAIDSEARSARPRGAGPSGRATPYQRQRGLCRRCTGAASRCAEGRESEGEGLRSPASAWRFYFAFTGPAGGRSRTK